jgi:putative membrane protein insertion efficiency factor
MLRLKITNFRIVVFVILCGPACQSAAVAGQLQAQLQILARSHSFRAATDSGSARFGTIVRETNPVKQVLYLGFLSYQKLLSSQDAPKCNFSPTCSRFGMEAFRHRGVLMGWLMTSDRLMRCNGLGGSYYATDPKTGKSHDPVGRYDHL